MGKLYTLDGKLLTETPEIRVGEKIYPVDNRKKTVTKILDAATSATKKHLCGCDRPLPGAGAGQARRQGAERDGPAVPRLYAAVHPCDQRRHR